MNPPTEQNLERASLIRKQRLKRGWSQAQLAEISDLSERTIQRVEKTGIAGLETLQALASAFNIAVEDLSSFPKEETKRESSKVCFLSRIKSGKDAISNMGNMEMYQNNYDELKNEYEVDLIGDFFQSIVDLGDLWKDLSETDKVRYVFDLNVKIKELEDSGFLVFGNRRKVLSSIKCVDGGKKNVPMEVSSFFLKRKECSQIIRKTPEEELLPVIFQ